LASLAKLPLDPRIGRMLVAARDLGCLKEVMVIAAGLSAQDPRERPQDRQQAADEKHKLFADEKSEFLSWWKLWNWFQNAVEHKKSNKQLIDNCHAHFLSYLRMREWREVHGQLHAMVTELGWKESELPGTYDAIHRRCWPACWGISAARLTNPVSTSARAASVT
jgi:ATP-dependent helicase HrpA